MFPTQARKYGLAVEPSRLRLAQHSTCGGGQRNGRVLPVQQGRGQVLGGVLMGQCRGAIGLHGRGL